MKIVVLGLLLTTKFCHSFVPTAVSQNCNAYASFWDNLLLEEYRENVEEMKERRNNWSRGRLEATGMSIFGASAEPDSELFGDKIVKIYKHGETRLRDRFTRGDVLILTPEVGFAGKDPMPCECLVIDVGKDWLSVGVGPSWPIGLWELRRSAGAYRVRLDRTASRAPLKAQRNALDSLRRGKAGESASIMANLFVNSPKYVDLAGEPPPHFFSDDIERNVNIAIENAIEATDFKPNKSQKDAIEWALKRKISLIRGPPGTGKTRTAAMLILTALQLEMRSIFDREEKNKNISKPRILAVTHSNGAADVLLKSLLQVGVPAVRHGRPASVSPNVQHRTIAAISERMPEIIKLRQKANNSTLDSQSRSSSAFEYKQYLKDVQEMIAKTAPVVVTSCIGSNQLLQSDESEVTFPIVVLDEAAQTTEPALLCALAAAKAQQVILVGDTCQLPPTVTSPNLRDSLGISPMERLENIGVGQITLKEQYRMPAALLEHPSKYFYNNIVTCANGGDRAEPRLPRGFLWPSCQPLAFVQTGHDSELIHNFGGRSNPTEAELVMNIVSDLISGGDVDAKEIAVITPYSKQVQIIREKLSNKIATKDVKVGTVDSFQGQETDIVIFSAVRSNLYQELGFLRDRRRLNVAITRSKRGLILVGDQVVLKTCRHWAALLNSCKDRGCSIDARDLRNEESIQFDKDANRQLTPDQNVESLLDKNDKFYGLFD